MTRDAVTAAAHHVAMHWRHAMLMRLAYTRGSGISYWSGSLGYLA